MRAETRTVRVYRPHADSLPRSCSVQLHARTLAAEAAPPVPVPPPSRRRAADKDAPARGRFICSGGRSNLSLAWFRVRDRTNGQPARKTMEPRGVVAVGWARSAGWPRSARGLQAPRSRGSPPREASLGLRLRPRLLGCSRPVAGAAQGGRGRHVPCVAGPVGQTERDARHCSLPGTASIMSVGCGNCTARLEVC